MTEDEFWSLLDVLGGSTDESAFRRLDEALRRLEPDRIAAFQERLTDLLFRLDVKPMARKRWRDVSEPRWLPRIPGISADGFLYARCAVIVAGRQTYESVLTNHDHFERRWDLAAESLLYAAPQAYEATTGATWDYGAGSRSYETGSNPSGGW